MNVPYKWISVGILAAMLLSGCKTSSTSAQRTSQPERCSSPATVYVFEQAAAITPQESDAWLSVSLVDKKSNNRRIEGVIPSETIWTVRDLSLSAEDGKRVAKYIQTHEGILFGGPRGSVVSAGVCFTSFDHIRILRLSVVSGPPVQRAWYLVEGLYAVGPTSVRAGGTITVVLCQGSYDDVLYQEASYPTVGWYAIHYNTAYPVSMRRVSANGLAIYEATIPLGIPKGTYFLAQLPPQIAEHFQPGSANGEVTGGFSFIVH